MEFTQPTTIATDSETEAHITALRVQIADKEVEINNLDSVIRSNKYAIEQLTKEKLELEGKLPELRTQKNTLEKEILQVVSQHEKALKNLDDVTVQATNLKSDFETRKAIIERMEEKLSNDIEALLKEKEEFKKEKALIEDREEALAEKIVKLKAIIN
jgi:chromosome segregation ATPase